MAVELSLTQNNYGLLEVSEHLYYAFERILYFHFLNLDSTSATKHALTHAVLSRDVKLIQHMHFRHMEIHESHISSGMYCYSYYVDRD